MIKPLTPADLAKIRTRLDEFERELEASEDLGDVFQVGYCVSAADIRRLLTQLEATEAEREAIIGIVRRYAETGSGDAVDILEAIRARPED
jgi:predicted nuclease with TOPRIM domain